jgi:hypothetical protein
MEFPTMSLGYFIALALFVVLVLVVLLALFVVLVLALVEEAAAAARGLVCAANVLYPRSFSTESTVFQCQISID